MYILKVYSIHYTLKQNTNPKKNPCGQNRRYKKCPIYFFELQTHHSFTINLRFLYELKDKVLSKTVYGIFHFGFRFVFVKVYIFVELKVLTLWLYNFLIPFKIKIIEKPHTVLLPQLWFLSCNKKFWNSMISAWVGAPQKLDWRRMF